MSYQFFLSPQGKRYAIVTYKHGICVLPHKCPNNLRLRLLETYEISENYLSIIE